MNRRRYYGGLLLGVLLVGATLLLFRPRVVPAPRPEASPALSASPPSSGWPRVFADALGERFALSAPAQRIVTLGPNYAEILFAIGAGDQLVGVTNFCDYPPKVAAKPRVGGLINPNLERILALEPDLLLVSRGVDLQLVHRLQELDCPVMAFDPQTLEEILTLISRLGEISGREDNAGRLVAALRDQIEKVQEQVRASGARRPRVLLVIAWEGLWVAGKCSFVQDLIEVAGGTNAVGQMSTVPSDQPWPMVTRELVVLSDPELLVFAGEQASPVGADQQAILSWLGQDQAWANLTAVRTGNVVVIDQDLLTIPGPRIMQGLEALHEAISEVCSEGDDYGEAGQ